MRLFAVLFCSLLLWCATAQAQVRNYDAIIAAGELKVAVYKDFPPYSFEDHGKPRGVDVELAQALASALGVRLQLIWAPPGEKLDDDLRDYIWRGSPLRHQQLADLMMRVPYDQAYAQKRNDLGELENAQVVMFGPYQQERWQVAYDQRRLTAVASVAVFQQHPIGVEVDSVPSFYLTVAILHRMQRCPRLLRHAGWCSDPAVAGRRSMHGFLRNGGSTPGRSARSSSECSAGRDDGHPNNTGPGRSCVCGNRCSRCPP